MRGRANECKIECLRVCVKKKGSGAGVRDKGEIGQKESGRGEEGKYWCMGKEGVDVRRGRDSDTCEETCEGRVLFEKRKEMK